MVTVWKAGEEIKALLNGGNGLGDLLGTVFRFSYEDPKNLDPINCNRDTIPSLIGARWRRGGPQRNLWKLCHRVVWGTVVPLGKVKLRFIIIDS